MLFSAFLNSSPTSISTRASTPKENPLPKNTSPIINGKRAQPGEFPFYATIFDDEGYLLCGGTLISENWVLTAGHCIDHYIKKGEDPLTLYVVVGINTLDRNIPALHYSSVDKYYIHEEYKDPESAFPTSEWNDIGLLHLTNSGKGIPTLSLFNLKDGKRLEQLNMDKNITIMGFGATAGKNRDEEPSLYLMKSENHSCKAYPTKPKNLFPQDRFKMYSNALEAYTGRGDSGSPAIAPYSSSIYVVGIASTLNTDGGRDIFTSVSYFYSWINEKTNIAANMGTYNPRMPNGDKRL